MKIILNTEDGTELTITLDTQDNPEGPDLPLDDMIVLQIEGYKFKVKADELARAITAIYPTEGLEI